MNKNGAPENLTPFKKGNPGGPGRPRGKSIITTIRDSLEKSFNAKDPETKKEIKMTGREIIAFKLMQKAMNGDLKAIAEIIDRLEGKPQQTVKSSNFNVDLHSIKQMSDEELESLQDDIMRSVDGENY